MAATFTCEMCGGTFERVTPEAEQVAEYERLFDQPIDAEETAIVCHDCWLAMGCDQIGANEA